MKPQEQSTVHRFRDLVSLSFPDTPTLYLTREHAAQLGGVLAKYADDIRCCKHLDSDLGEDGYIETSQEES